jgi:anti-anti-sigma factor
MLTIGNTRMGNVAVLCLQGRIVRGEADDLRGAVLAQLDPDVVVLDLARVNTIDAGGLGSLLDLREQTESRGIEFRLMNVTRLVGQVLEITRLSSVFGMLTEREVLSRIRPRPFAPVRQLAACA